MNYLRPGLFSARDHQAALRVTTAAEIFFRHSKWHRLNQEVEKTTEKNKLDTIHYFFYFDARFRPNAARLVGGFGLRTRNTFTVGVI